MVGGSGPADRDNDTFFPPIRRRLAAAGIAVLSYDQRGVGSSSGDWRDASLDDLAADAAAARAFLQTQLGVRADVVDCSVTAKAAGSRCRPPPATPIPPG